MLSGLTAGKFLRLTVPIGNVFVGDSRCDIKHDDTALAIDVVAVAKSTKFLLTSRVPDVELYTTIVLVLSCQW